LYCSAPVTRAKRTAENLPDFYGAKGHPAASMYNMQPSNMSWQPWAQSVGPAAFRQEKEPKLKLSLETRNSGDVIIVHCQGRVVYRDEAAALARVVGEALQHASKLVLDLSGVTSIDSAGIGELALLETWAQGNSVSLKCAGASGVVQDLLELTNLDTVLDIHPSIDAALVAFEDEKVCADC
jgi:anti-anti-sigma factor